jgi:TorA maturation chaperone TorD
MARHGPEELGVDRDVVLVALRDFFAARDGRAMAAAYTALSQADSTAGAMHVGALLADDIECDFNRLFVGPGKVAAPPYASVYLDSDHRLMGDATRRAAAIYDAIGLASPLPGSLPDDHLALELDAVLAFRALLACKPSAELEILWRYFLHDHLALWVPRFVAAVRGAGQVPAAVTRVVTLLSAWLDEEIDEAASAAEHQRGAACTR